MQLHQYISRGREYVRMHGLSYTLRHGLDKFMESRFGTFEQYWKAMECTPDELEWQRAHAPQAGTLTIVVPVYRPRVEHLKALIESIREQSYTDFEALMYEAGGLHEIRTLLRETEKSDPRFRIIEAGENQGISRNTNRAAEQVYTPWMVLTDHDDLLTKDALYRLACVIAQGNADVVYTDEDKVTENGRLHTDAHWKPDFCPDSLRSANYVCHLLAVRTSVYFAAGGEDSRFDGSQDHDLMLRLSEVTTRIVHVPRICYHWRTLASSMSHSNRQACMEASARAVTEHMERTGLPGTAVADGAVLRLRYKIRSPLTVEAIVLEEHPGEGRKSETYLGRSTYTSLHVRSVTAPSARRFQVINEAVEQSRADVLLFLDASVLPTDPGIVEEMLMYAQRDDVGAVTVALTDRKGRILHAGFAVGADGTVRCRQQGIALKAGGFHILLRQSHNISAMSAACFMVRKDHFLPFRMKLDGTMEMVDWCLCMQKAGYRHVYTPHGAAHAGKSRWLMLKPGAQADLYAAWSQLWPEYQDPCWNPWLRTDRADYRPVSLKALRAIRQAEQEKVGTGHE